MIGLIVSVLIGRLLPAVQKTFMVGVRGGIVDPMMADGSVHPSDAEAPADPPLSPATSGELDAKADQFDKTDTSEPGSENVNRDKFRMYT